MVAFRKKVKTGLKQCLTDVTQEVTFCLNVVRYLKYPSSSKKRFTPCALRFLMLAPKKAQSVLRTAEP